MVLFCFKNVRIAKFIKWELGINTEFSKTDSNKVWGKKAKGHVLPLSLSGKLAALYLHLDLMAPVTEPMLQLTSVMRERGFCCLSEGLFTYSLPLARGRKLDGEGFRLKEILSNSEERRAVEPVVWGG